MVKYILFALLIYIAYQFIFRLVVPVYMASKKFKQGIREMQQRMDDHARGQQGFNTAQTAPSQPKPKEKPGDYIDFEEVE